MAKITINGNTITLSGSGIRIVNGRVIVDGLDATPDAKEIRIEIHGNVETIEADSCDSINVSGSVHDVLTQTGDVTCGDVLGGVRSTSGDIRCADVRGSVESVSGDVHANTIQGRVRTVTGRVR